MQAFANVATAPTRKTTQNGGKVYWEFRAAESAKNEDKAGATWYTVRVFQEDDPGFSKGDFVRLVGKLKLDVFMSREGKPMGVLVIMCFEAKRYETSARGKAAALEKPVPVSMKTASTDAGAEASAQLEDLIADESWLALVG
jgi:single-stranded DNA-binding protein